MAAVAVLFYGVAVGSAAPSPAGGGGGFRVTARGTEHPESLDIADFGRPSLRTFSLSPSHTVFDLAVDGQGYLWAGTTDGAAVYDGREWTNVPMPRRSRSNIVYQVSPAKDGSMWFATRAGVARLERGVWTAYDEADGLPSSDVRLLLETIDDDGTSTLWAGTVNGLARYRDGEWTRVPLRSPSTTPSEASEPERRTLLSGDGRGVVTTIVEETEADGTRSLWVGTLGDGVARLRQGRWEFYDTSSGLPDNRITSLTVSRKTGTVWIGTASGLAFFRDGQWEADTSPEGPAGSFVGALLETEDDDGEGVLWAAAPRRLMRYRGGVWHEIPSTESGSGGIFRELLATVEADGTHSVWVGTGVGIIRYRKGVWTLFQASTIPEAVEANVRIMMEVAGRNGERALWVGTDAGLMRVTGDQWLVFDTSTGLVSSGSAFPQILAMREAVAADGSMAMWMKTPAGLAHYERGTWTTIRGEDVPGGVVGPILTTRSGNGPSDLWVGTPSGLLRREGERWRFLHVSSDPLQDQVFTLAASTAADGSPAMWIGTGGGIVRYENGVFTPVGEQSGPRSRFNCLLETLDEGVPTTWFGTNGGLIRMRNGQTTVFDTSSGLRDDVVVALCASTGPNGQKTLWLATAAGLARVDGDRITTYDPDSGLPDSRIYHLLAARVGGRDRFLVVGTRFGGMAWLDLDDPGATWTTITESRTPALPNNTINDFCQDRQDRLYVLTNNGIARLTPRGPTHDDPSDFAVELYTTENGLPTRYCQDAVVDSRGRVWLGTYMGAAMLDPSREVVDRTPDPLHIEDARLDGTNERLADESELTYDQSTIEF